MARFTGDSDPMPTNVLNLRHSLGEGVHEGADFTVDLDVSGSHLYLTVHRDSGLVREELDLQKLCDQWLRATSDTNL